MPVLQPSGTLPATSTLALLVMLAPTAFIGLVLSSIAAATRTASASVVAICPAPTAAISTTASLFGVLPSK